MLVSKVATTETPAKTLNTPSQPKLAIIPLEENMMVIVIFRMRGGNYEDKLRKSIRGIK